MDVPWKIQLLFWFLQKIASVWTIYSLVLSFKEDSSGFTYTFLAFFIVEILIRIIYSILYLEPRTIDCFIIIILSPSQLEELFIILFHSRFNIFIIEKDIIGFSFGKSLSSVPQYAMVVLKLLNSSSPNLITLLLGIFTLLSLAITLIITIYQGLFFYDETNFTNFNSKKIIAHINEALIACLHFITYTALLWVNFTLVHDFYISLIIIYSILAISYLISITQIENNRVQKMFYSNFQFYYCILMLLIKQTLHIDFDQRKVQSSFYPDSMQRFSIKLFDNMIGFSMILKFYLLIVLFLRVIIGDTIESEYLKVGVIVLLAFSLVSFGIYAIRFIEYVILPLVNGPEQIEIISEKQLQKLIQMYQLSKIESNYPQQKNFRNLKRIFGEVPNMNQVENRYLQLVVDSVLCLFEGIEVVYFGEQFNRKNQVNESGFYEVKIETNSSIDLILTSLSNYSLLPNIGKLDLNQPPELFSPLVKKLLTNDNLIELKSNTISNQKIKVSRHFELLNYIQQTSEVRLTCLNAIIFTQLIAPTQRVNPLAIYYDLYDN